MRLHPKDGDYCDLFILISVLFCWRLFRIFPTWYKLSYTDRPNQWAILWLGYEFIFEQLVSRDMGACTLAEWKESQKT